MDLYTFNRHCIYNVHCCCSKSIAGWDVTNSMTMLALVDKTATNFTADNKKLK